MTGSSPPGCGLLRLQPAAGPVPRLMASGCRPGTEITRIQWRYLD